jgi:EpsI family protein
MFRSNKPYSPRRSIPLLSTAILFGFLLFIFPFNSGDTAEKSPLGWTLWSMWTASDDTQDYSYCLLVPIIAAYLVFERKRQLAAVTARGSTSAIAWLILGLFLFWIGARAGKQYLGCAGIQVLLAGAIFWLWGGAMFRPLLFAWIFITFAWPLPFIDSAVAFPMRMIVSHLAYDTLNLVGIPCLQDGTALLSLPNPQAGLTLGARFEIDIADPCSGLRSLMPLLMFSACYSYFFLPWTWQRWTVFLSAFPLIIIGNVTRILLLVLGCLQWGSAFAFGTNTNPSWYHEACGFAVFIVVLGLEFLLGFLLLAVKPHRSNKTGATASNQVRLSPSTSPVAARPVPTADVTAGASPVPFWRSAVILGLALIMMIVWLVTPPLYLPTQAGILMSLPSEVTVPNLPGGLFFGSDAPVSEAEHTLLPKDTQFSRKNYDDFSGHQIFFSIVLSGLQQYTIHPPQVCLVAQGWKIVKEENVPIRLDSGHELIVRNLSIQRDEVDKNKDHRLIQAYYMYWYVADGITTPSHATRNWVSSWDRIFHNRDHRWAYVIAMSAITQSLYPEGLDAAQTREMLTAFIRQIVPTFQKSELPEQVGWGDGK